MAGFNEIDRVRMPEGGVVGSGSPDGATRRKRGFIDAIPKSLVAVALCLIAYGLLVVWSAVQGNEDYSFTRQLMGVGLGVVAMMVFYSIDYRQLAGYTTLLLIVNVVLIFRPICRSSASRRKAHRAGSTSACSCSLASSPR